MKRLVLAWLALLLLLAASAGSAWLHLGPALLAVSLAIAAAKVAIVGWLFMELGRRGRVLPRLAAAAGFAALLVMLALSAVDLRVRRDEASAWQQPQAVPPAISSPEDR